MAESAKTGTEEFGNLLRRARERQGMSRRDLAAATELSYPYISQLETGYRQPSPAAIQSLATALRISLDEMFDAMGRRPEEPPPVMSNARWVANSSYAGGGSGLRASAPQDAPRFAPLPAPSSRHRAENLAGEAEVADGVVDEVMDLLSGLPAEHRLAALAKIQDRTVRSAVDDGIRGRR